MKIQKEKYIKSSQKQWGKSNSLNMFDIKMFYIKTKIFMWNKNN